MHVSRSGRMRRPSSPTARSVASALLATLGLAAGAIVLAPAAASAQSNAIAFTSLRGGDARIYAVDADGGSLRRLTQTPGAFDGAPAYSPDGRRIAFTCGNFELCLMNSDGSGAARLTTNDWPREFRYDTSPAWSSDGTRIAFVRTVAGEDGLWIVNADGSGLRQLPVPTGVNASPSFSPDGSLIAFAHAEDETGDSNLPSSSESAVHVIRTDGGGSRTLTGPGLDAMDPAWSPDGRHIAFVRGNDESPPQILVMDADGSELRRVTKRMVHAASPAWSPDSARIVFSSVRAGGISLYHVAATGGEPVRLTTGRGPDFAPAWQPIGAATVAAPLASPAAAPSAATADARVVGMLLRTLVSFVPVMSSFENERASDLMRAAERFERLSRRTSSAARPLRPQTPAGRRVRRLVLQSAAVMRGVAGETRQWSRSVARRDRRAARKNRTDALLGALGGAFTLAEAMDVAGLSQASLG